MALGCLRRHPYSHAMTGVQAPHRSASPSKSPPCVRCAPQEARGRDRYAQTELRSPICVETSCVTRLRVRSPCGAPRGISGPGPCSPLSFVGLCLRFDRHRNRPSETSVQASRGSLGIPSGIVRLSSHGSSLPGGAGLASLPGAVANRIGDATASLRLKQGRP